jgi:hypothetical protein
MQLIYSDAVLLLSNTVPGDTKVLALAYILMTLERNTWAEGTVLLYSVQETCEL